MAIVFVSPRKVQKMFFGGIITLIALLLFAISLLVLLPELRNKLNDIPANIPVRGDFNGPDLKINFRAIDSDEVKNLEPFGAMEGNFSYIAEDENGRQITGKISAASREDAEKNLAAMGLTIQSIEEITIGRNEPFVPYYQTETK
ncbi:MAG: hypothetical protein A3A98_00570 [Candidatus Staskawiczbacteria bacterium RIFCSPLOWO2_01_FULL_40_39]|uniref:Uncharacterized protein n=1 Tax=Candidatus Staskawiczbacteria bacterium RIFCSPHIGHO2_01_FULL_39_25 TaxID=1802202 RepID=A0A1G2HNF6_9BACT|nr:MAG: hypothetical protein A2730_00570 [Candidatus Staskawiczbacteria bacterium RIFCSPHIGHO2_01_FULL_39_25]OGZ73228.1 MAG: hypothetical protein A3A98_00570 [Candidatus Staskawiczbacteria bacterium RIFCSPLOWO2_01_FULL_40_39]OGZ76405.1 MAG: hypothetical protein A3I87_01785 [Candidatus Staskawiczbacteria bacterium RIFCSPLOWO2_02_FULL_39_8]